MSVSISGKVLSYELKVPPEICDAGEGHWAVLTVQDVNGRLAEIHTPIYEDEATVKQHCEKAMEWGEVWATGYWYESGVGKVFLVEKWSSIRNL